MGKFDIKLVKDNDRTTLHLVGVIDEDVDFTKFSLSGYPSMEIDLSLVKGINSCGIREWIKWIRTAGEAPITYIKCAKLIVDQINMVDGFLPATGKVRSFYVPYYSDKNGTEKNILFQYGTEFSESGVIPPESVLDADGSPMEMDVIEAKYFRFISKK